MKDEKGNPVENATNRVEVEVNGAARLVGLDNGDSTDYDSYKGKSRRLFSGKLMAILAATLDPGKIEVKVTSKGMDPKFIELTAIASEEEVLGISASMENKDIPPVMGNLAEIPLRKIELISEAGQFFTSNKKRD